ncbi:hypothetical protein [Aurantimonas sp. VKM B-3413]|uniref:hypothetical protein n=1 Tax=Aurantimonas sp. VKM B-3413 TaxID=2779401 RepID=UPI001E562C0F|nr:hypothetical protein [Aurantimonas sp. VKM B-3413]MCB8839494.1 hypothetical protein [Aurantimonas sp. VKM B-3413]
MAMFVRTIDIVRAEVEIGMANLAYNLTHLVWQQGRSAPARVEKAPKSACSTADR